MTSGSISLRPGEWGSRPVALAVCARGEGWAVLDQPSPSTATVPLPEGPTKRLESVLAGRVAAGVRAIRSLFPQRPKAVFAHPHGGPVPFASSKETLSRLREEYGSYRWEFRFLLLARTGPGDDSARCDLPVAVHRDGTRSLVSHRTGKRASTRFVRLARGPGLELWEARTDYLRPDQIRLHAAETGIAVAGEGLYAEAAPVSRADLPGRRRPGGPRHVLFPEPAVHLASLAAPAFGDDPVRSSPPRAFAKWIEAYAP